VKQSGQEFADRIMGIILRHYTRLAYINTGQKDQERYRQYAMLAAKKFNLRFEELTGSNTLIRKLIYGPWDNEIFVSSPGHTIEYLDFVTSEAKTINTTSYQYNNTVR